jgi:hypothetical protein
MDERGFCSRPMKAKKKTIISSRACMTGRPQSYEPSRNDLSDRRAFETALFENEHRGNQGSGFATVGK